MMAATVMDFFLYNFFSTFFFQAKSSLRRKKVLEKKLEETLVAQDNLRAMMEKLKDTESNKMVSGFFFVISFFLSCLGVPGDSFVSSDADWTIFGGVVRFLQKWLSPGPVQGLVVRSAVRSAVQKYKSFLCASIECSLIFDNPCTHTQIELIP